MRTSRHIAAVLAAVVLALSHLGGAPRVLPEPQSDLASDLRLERSSDTADGIALRPDAEVAPPVRLAPGAADAAALGTIRGRVELHQRVVEPIPHASVADVGMSAMHAPTDRRSVIYLDPAPRAAFDTRDEPHAWLDQRDETFVPHVLAIVAGTTVDFPNSDQTYHNVFSLSKAKSFDLGRYAVGRIKSVRFDRPGIVRVFCDIHSHMSAFILVFSHRYFSVVDDQGHYRLENVPPGNYNVVAWNESVPLETSKVVVPEAGGEVELNVALGRR
jgi:plastocyanin